MLYSSAAIALTYRANKKSLFVAWDALAILAIYVLVLFVLYGLR
jgi:hypothetical protein